MSSVLTEKGLAASSMVIVAEGGAICSIEGSDAGHTLYPDAEVVERLCAGVPSQLRSVLGELQISFPEDGLRLSRDVTIERIAQFVRRIIGVFQEKREGTTNVVGLVGSKGLPKYAAAVMLGLNKESLGNGSVILAATRSPDDAQDVVDEAIDLSTHSAMRGRAGAFFEGKLLALPGLSRVPGDLMSRFRPVASLNGQRGQWLFAPPSKQHTPIGSSDDGEFDLDPGVRTVQADEGGEERSVFTAKNLLKKGMTGMVVKTQERGDPFRGSLGETFLQEINAIGVPAVFVVDTATDPPKEPSPYPNLVDGRRLSAAEAKITLAHTLALAKRPGRGRPRTPEEVMEFVRMMFAHYPLR